VGRGSNSDSKRAKLTPAGAGASAELGNKIEHFKYYVCIFSFIPVNSLTLLDKEINLVIIIIRNYKVYRIKG
jgi:hypothetical protein